ncbi:MAG: hypothetical protein QM586_10475, partial [Xenophilus sp.]
MSSSGTDAPHLLIPFAGPRSAHCRAVLGTLALPRLQALLARLMPGEQDRTDEGSLSPPHERALARAQGWSGAPDGLLPWAAAEARRLALPGADTPGWGRIDLCHWQVGMSEVVLHDPARLNLAVEESETLRLAMRPFFSEDGLDLHPTPRPGQWLARGRLLDGLPTASIDRAAGQPLGAWLPMGEAARGLRRLLNEMQMLLYTHRANDERAARGLPPINSFWLSGTGRLPGGAAAGAAPVLDTSLRAAALDDDSAAWAAAWETLDAGPLARLLERSRAGAPVRLT